VLPLRATAAAAGGPIGRAGSARSPASGPSYSRGEPIRRVVVPVRRRSNPGYSTNNPVVVCLNTNPCIIGAVLLINLLLPAIRNCVVHLVHHIGKLTCTFVLRIRGGIGQAVVTPSGLRSTRRCINHLN
jgi:hypothetical protein